MQESPNGPRLTNGLTAPFSGFALPTSNTTYTPNQFFDVCLPHSSRGCVRLVAYLIRKTRGWSDANGHPLREQHAISYSELEARAGISHDMIHSAIDEAIRRRFIRCLNSARRKVNGASHQTGRYTLNWDEHGSGEYVKDPKRFGGFFAGEGNCTYIPNQFFDHLIPNETLAVTKVVGSVTRFSIGFQTKWGHRRQQVSLSYQDIQNYSHIRNRGTLSDALCVALAANYLQRVEDGYFDRNGGRQSRAATYALKWLDRAAPASITQKNVPAKFASENHSEKRTGIAPKNGPADHSEKRTDIQITKINNTLKQQTDVAAFSRLIEAGFGTHAARVIASKYSGDVIDRQIDWIDSRNFNRNRLGMLRQAIQQDWSAPSARWGRDRREKLGAPNFQPEHRGASFADALERTRRKFISPRS